MLFLGLTSSLQAFACPNLSGRYFHGFDDSDFRESACLTVTQDGCNTITVSDWSTRMRNGTVDVVDMKEFPPRVWTVAESADWFSSPATWERATAGQCGQ
jgi:hypothetical protein